MKTLAITGLSVLIGLIGLLFAFGLTRSNEGPPESPDVPIQAAPGGTSAEAALPAAKASEVGGERALVGSGALLRVVDESGAPIADAVLAIQRGASHAPGVAVEQVAADAEGRIDLGALAPGGNWFVGAPDFDWSAVDAVDREVVLDRLPLARIEAVDVFGSSSFAGKRVRWLGDPALTTNVKGAEKIKAVQLVAGEELHVALQELAVGAVRFESDAPLGAEVTMWFREVVPVPAGSDDADWDIERYFRTTLRVEPESFERQAYDFLVNPAEYRVDVRVKWAAADFDTISAETRLSLEVRAGEVQVLRVNLLDKLLENLARVAEGNPELEQVLSKMGG